MKRKITLELSAGEIKKSIADLLKSKGYSAEKDDITLNTDYRRAGLFTNGHYYCSGATVIVEEDAEDTI